ncbi:hypothetical protein AJ80_08841 [Polytolypa hystricis UAMH7299]|uniref:Amidase domain-containing protein n=1 Tax=Polytolypa hystricis (strain UAMH7299) TaxID=1447883 RepID=A0A2B7X112_POLH7|nr:hypothetical protein AJ80_08841 [Polytolypa hystricis UAMH7299]
MNPGAGSTALRGAEYPEDSTVVAKLRDAGVVLLGLAGLSQWANFRSTNSSNGWSAIGGQVMGAYVDMQDPSGSSSGSGVASDLGLAWATLGTETSGSIISPSQFNNIVGIKPTVGLTSRHLVVPISQHQDTVGPMARTVRDAAKLLSAIAGKDPKDNYTSAIPFDTIPDYAAACTTDSNSISLLQGKRLGIPRNFINRYNQGLGAPPLASFDAAISTLSGAGAVIIDNANFPSFDDFDYQGDALSVVFADFLNDIASFFAQLKTNPNNLTSLSDLRAFTQTSAVVEEEEFPDRNTGIWDAALAAGFTNTDPSFFPLHSSLISFAGEGYIRGALKTHNLDALILPSDISPFIPAILGSPVITVPMGAWPEGTPVIFEPRGELVVRAPGMPVGLSFLGDLWSEEGLVGIACGFEGVSGERGKKLGRVVQPGMELVDVL